MPKAPAVFANIDEYIRQFPPETQLVLNELRQLISEAAPQAQEKISYQMPTFYLKGNLIHFAAYKNHIGFYPAPSGIRAYRSDSALSNTNCGKGREEGNARK